MTDSEQPQDRAEVWIFPPALLALCIILGLALALIAPHPAVQAQISVPIGVVCLIGGITIDRTAQRALRAVATTVHPDHATSAIVETGLFGMSRNPIYLAQGLLLLSAGWLFGHVTYFAAGLLWFAVITAGVIRPEEVYLTAKFGDDYLAYQRRVRRWL